MKIKKYNDKKDEIEMEYDKKNLYDFFESKGFFFSREVLTRYFISLKTKFFVILTGISGTGKTKIAQIFADYICQNEQRGKKEKRIAFISVRPDWMDNKGLLGFYNILDETYHETPFLNLILEAKDNPNVPYFVIFDEMNLAKVEQYFSDFLSIMESRTSDNRAGEPLFLHSLNKVKTLSGNEIPGRIHIPENIYFTGTVNVDETTYMFSPKVLDRANVIEFNEVDLEGYISGSRKEDKFCLENPDVTNGLISSEVEPFCSSEDFKKLKTIIEDLDNPFEELLNRLKRYNLHFGYRVVNEMSRFVWISKDFIGDHFDPNEAFDIQILQKILPKFHGTQGKLEAPLKNLLSFCYGQSNPKENIPDEMIQKAVEFDDEAVYPRSAKKIARMLKNLKNQGYTSFIE
jgi:5-methylcytosine-specific restriction enzyme B